MAIPDPLTLSLEILALIVSIVLAIVCRRKPFWRSIFLFAALMSSLILVGNTLLFNLVVEAAKAVHHV